MASRPFMIYEFQRIDAMLSDPGLSLNKVLVLSYFDQSILNALLIVILLFKLSRPMSNSVQCMKQTTVSNNFCRHNIHPQPSSSSDNFCGAPIHKGINTKFPYSERRDIIQVLRYRFLSLSVVLVN